MVQKRLTLFTVPDLVFSKMNFLQDSNDKQEYTAQASQGNKKRKKDYARTKEEDISAFFTSTRPALAGIQEDSAPRSDQPSNSAAARRSEHSKRAREAPDRSVHAVSTVKSEGRASHPKAGRRSSSHESTSYFSWSESIRAPSAAPAQANSPLFVPKRHFDSLSKTSAEGQYGRYTTVDQQMPTLARSVPVSIVPDHTMVSSATPKCPRLQSPLRRSSSLQLTKLGTRSVEDHATEVGASSRSMPPVSRTSITADHLDVPVVERLRKASYGNAAKTPFKYNPGHVPQGFMSCESPQLLTGIDEALQYYDDLPASNVRRVTSYVFDHTAAHPARELPDTAGQAERIPYRGNAQAPTVRFVVPNVQASGLSRFSGPTSFYVGQAQQPRYDDEAFDYRHADAAHDEYACESDLSDREALEDISDTAALYEKMEDIEVGHDELGHVESVAEEIQTPEHTEVVVGPSFWRPHRLY